MNKKKGRWFMGVLLSLFTFFSTGGCTKEQEYTTGGTTNKTDPDAPKVIQSKDITEFQASFFLANRWAGEEEHDFQFQIQEENGVLTASEKIMNIHAQADEQLLKDLQAVIDKYDLASMNGVYEVTAGLAPECQEREFNVVYASGETLRFTINNEPYARWAEDIYGVFADWFSSQGNDALLPAQETSPVTRIRFVLQEYGIMRSYSGVNVQAENTINGETYLLNGEIYDLKQEKEILDEYRLFPADYFERITEILDDYDIVTKYDFSRYDYEERNYGNHDKGYFGWGDQPAGEKDSVVLSLTLHLEYESGKRINIDTKKASEIEGMKSVITDLLEYYDSLFVWERNEE
ncbi:MAG: hypothetical protein IIZ27_04290 [Solobacterium sp.]|nr:hypothetical protein [Solobacterium sp.]